VRYSKEFKCWPLDGREHLNLTAVETNGETLEQLRDYACLWFADWHGNEACEGWTYYDLPQADQDGLDKLFTEALKSARGMSDL
jgi:hypothetical protein